MLVEEELNRRGEDTRIQEQNTTILHALTLTTVFLTQMIEVALTIHLKTGMTLHNIALSVMGQWMVHQDFHQ